MILEFPAAITYKEPTEGDNRGDSGARPILERRYPRISRSALAGVPLTFIFEFRSGLELVFRGIHIRMPLLVIGIVFYLHGDCVPEGGVRASGSSLSPAVLAGSNVRLPRRAG